MFREFLASHLLANRDRTHLQLSLQALVHCITAGPNGLQVYVCVHFPYPGLSWAAWQPDHGQAARQACTFLCDRSFQWNFYEVLTGRDGGCYTSPGAIPSSSRLPG